MNHGEKIVDGITLTYLCQPCPECQGKLEAAEGMAKQLAAFLEWIADGALTSSDREMFRRAFQTVLSAWEKAGKGEG